MKPVKILAFMFFLCLFSSQEKVQAQTYCDTVFALVPQSATFQNSIFSGGDSVLTVLITNISAAQSMAYPTAKIINRTPLPTGMSLATMSQSFQTVFASSYVPGDTMEVRFYFDVTNPIPVDYTVWFELWADADNSNGPIDSCFVQDTFEVNLNPAPVSSSPVLNVSNAKIWAHPESGQLWVQDFQGSLRVMDALGRLYKHIEVQHRDVQTFPLQLPPGIYFLYSDTFPSAQRIVWY